MTEHEDNKKRIFDLAISVSAERRGEILARECAADVSLRGELEELLLTADRTGDGSEAPTIDGTDAMAESVTQGPGATIGPYRLVELIGEGGFGSVYMAEQTEPVQRRVALKIIKLGMDTQAVIGRFEQERQALAVMDHPHIAKVLDAGTTEAGRPFFVMELVEGQPISVYADENRLTVRQRLELFGQVCNGIQHAHSKGIIHRDIKPSNVLVSTHDGRPFARVIDFGIAKAIDQHVTEETMFTEHGQLVGTPLYMSPEQAEGSFDIDTRSDVYALGVMLYELLTGTTPLDPRQMRAAAFGEIYRMVREIDPPRPSTRLASVTATASAVAENRSAAPDRLKSLLRGELDWIAMRALEKERSRRYETANGLAMDIQRYLSGEAVDAAPPSQSYRFKKFVHRHKGLVTAVGAVAAALLVGLAAFAWQATVARDQRDRAIKAEGEATARADELKLVSDFQAGMLSRISPPQAGDELSADVTAKFAEAMADANPPLPETERSALVESFTNQWNRLNSTNLALSLIDRTIFKPAIETIDTQFADQPVVEAALRQVLATQYLQLGLYDAAMPLQERALETRRRVLGNDHPDTMTSIQEMAFLLQVQGRLDEAEPYFREVLERRRRVLGDEHPDTLVSLGGMDFLLQGQGKLAEAEVYSREVLETRRRVLGNEDKYTLLSISNLCVVLMYQGKLDEAEPYCREALGSRRRVLGDFAGDTVISINILAYMLISQGKLAEAEPYQIESVELSRKVLGDEHPDTMTAVGNLGHLLKEMGRLSEAEPHLREAQQTYTKVLGESHPLTLRALSNLAWLVEVQGRHAEVIELLVPAEPAMRAGLQGSNVLVLARALMNLGLARAGLGFDAVRFAAAEGNLLEAHELYFATRGEEHKDTRSCALALADFYERWAKASPGEGHEAQAAEWKAVVDPEGGSAGQS